MKIVQLLPALAYGDAVGNDTLALHDALVAMGHEAAIYAEHVDKRFREKYIHSYKDLPDLEKDDIIIYHFSTGSEIMVDILKKSSCRKVMVYHNITPGHFFAPYDPDIMALVDDGRRELRMLKDLFEACICDSRYNLEDLKAAGYDCPMAVLPILIPFEDYDQAPEERVLAQYQDDGFVNFLFVGRIVPNKKQEDVIKAFAYYHDCINDQSRLFIVGNPNSQKYLMRLAEYAARLGLADSIKFTGSIPFREILAYYKLADVFLCMSAHEGFCVPLVEAMYFRKPVLAYNEAAVGETMGDGTGWLSDKSPAYVAACVNHILTDEVARQKLLERQSECLARFEHERIETMFREMMGHIIGRDYEAFSSLAEPEEIKSFFEGFSAGEMPEAELLSFEEVPIPLEIPAPTWRGIIRRRVLKPIFNVLAQYAPGPAGWLRKNIYGAYYRFKDRKRVSFEPWKRSGEPCLFVDTTQISHRDDNTGIQRVVNNIFRQLHGLQGNVMAVRDYDGRLVTSYGYMKRCGFAGADKEQLIEFLGEDKLLLLDSSWDFVGTLRSAAQNLHRKGGRVGVVVYDLFPVQYPELFSSQAFVNVFKAWHNMVLAEADDILCISRTTADNVEKYFREYDIKRKSPMRLHYFPMGAEIRESQGEPRKELQRFVKGGTTFLMVGTIEPRKGHAVAIEAFEKLLAGGGEAKLLIIGKDGWKNDGFEKMIRQEAVRDKILWLKDAGDAELQWAYKNASALIAASKDEGYGLPLIEAAYFGIPIIASDIPIFHEVTLENADYFRGMDADDLCRALQDWLATENHPDSKKIRLYTWQESAQVILDIMNDKQEPYKVLS